MARHCTDSVTRRPLQCSKRSGQVRWCCILVAECRNVGVKHCPAHTSSRDPVPCSICSLQSVPPCVSETGSGSSAEVTQIYCSVYSNKIWKELASAFLLKLAAQTKLYPSDRLAYSRVEVFLPWAGTLRKFLDKSLYMRENFMDLRTFPFLSGVHAKL